MFSLFSPVPDSTDLSLKCEDSKALSLQTCDFFQKISRSNLWLTDPWQLQISLFLSLLALHLVEKLSDSHLRRAAQVFIMCVHTEYPIWCTPQRLAAPPARTLHTVTRAREPFVLLYFSFLLRKKKILSHLLFFLDVSTLRECGPRARTHRGEGGGDVHALAPVFSFQNNTILQWKLRAINPFKWPNGWQTYAFASLLGG